MNKSADDVGYVKFPQDEIEEQQEKTTRQRLCNCGYLYDKYNSSFIFIYALKYSQGGAMFPVLHAF